MNDDRVEREVRAWLVSHTEARPPDSLRAFLAELPRKQPPLDRVQPRGALLIRPARRELALALVAIVVVAVGAGLVAGLGPWGPTKPSPSVAVKSTAPPSSVIEQTGTPVIDAALVDASHGWALTHDDLLWTSDAGASWASIRPVDVPPSTIRSVKFIAPQTGWLATWTEAGGDMTVWRTSDAGAHWRSSKVPGTFLDGIGQSAFDELDEGTVFLQVQLPSSSAGSRGSLFVSRDGGISWTQTASVPGGWPVRFGSPLVGWTASGPLGNRFHTTADGGQSWREVPIDLPPGYDQFGLTVDVPTFTDRVIPPTTGVLPVTLFAQEDPNTGDRVASLAMYTTRDGGGTWRLASTIGQTTAIGQGVTIPSAVLSQTTWLVAVPGRGNSILERTTDGGTTWVDLGATGLAGFIGALDFVDVSHGWALTPSQGSDYQVAATADGGRIWRTLDPRTQAPTTPAPTTPTAAGPYHWTLVSSDGELATYFVVPAIRRRDGSLLAVGVAAAGQPRMLTSPDGRKWTLQPSDPGLSQASALHFSMVNSVTEGSTDLVAVGAAALDDVSAGDARAWTSQDGLHWRVAVASSGMTDASMEAVTAGPNGFVAVGSDGFPGGNTQLPGARGAAVWRSPDGTTWSRVPSQASFAGAVMFGIRRTSSGYIAWGEIHDPAGVSPPLPPIWTSPDGLRWDRATGVVDAGGPSTPIESILAVGDRLIAVGGRQLPESKDSIIAPAIWSSSDGGGSWTLATVPDGSGAPRSGAMWSVAAIGSDLVVVGRVDTPGQGEFGSAIVWQSTDQGATWTELPGDPSFAGATIERLVAIDGGFVAFGSTNDPNAYADANLIWVGVRQP